ncbi:MULTISPECIES: chromate efflux transporter [unclassified Minwuia]|uniref:chromate efflux transporter n=1 Tax=unclassified Minwuia TaxID=2618799 RepID=UPI00247AF7A6|nr:MULTISPECIES: chromate efflux transporter [unclassified Minwuia]
MTESASVRLPAGAPAWPDVFRAFGRIGLLSFGGPAAQIALMHRVLVEEKRWLSERQYLDALSFCMLLPGPEAMQLATYAGWRLRGVPGGLLAGMLFVIPGACVVLGLAILYAHFGKTPLLATLFLGIKAAVLVIVVEALLKVARRALHRLTGWIIAGAAFGGIFLFELPFPLIIVAAAVVGFSLRPGAADAREAGRAAPAPVSVRSTGQTVLLWLFVWWAPLLLLDLLAAAPVLATIGHFFSKLAVVTFGGAYAVLAYMAQQVVTGFGWLSAGEMLDGLGLAETTPGPLILVTEFVGFLAGFRSGGLWLGLAGAMVTLWATFAPCFLWIFAGAPYIEWISGQPRLRGALAAITASVVGVMLNLSIWFALHVMFANVTRQTVGPLTLWQPELASIDWRVPVLSLLSAVLLLRLHWGIGRVLAISAATGWVLAEMQ